MIEVLTQGEYEALAQSLTLPCNAFIDGGFRPAISGRTFTTQNPATGAVLGEVAACGPEDVEFAVRKARDAFEDGRWSHLHPGARKEVLLQLAKLMERNAHELAVLESLDSGKPVYDCATVDVPETIHCLKWHAELIDKIYDQVAPSSDDHIALVVREPVGGGRSGAALELPAAHARVENRPGARLRLLGPGQTRRGNLALRLAELAMEAGLPAGVLNILTGSGREVGEPIGRHMDIDMVSFTGSTVTGKRFLSYAADSNAKEVVLEMGGKNPCIVLDDAENLDVVAAHVTNGAFWNMGENCSAASRLIVQKGIKDSLLARVIAHTRDWPVGAPLNPETRVGALVSKAHFDKVASYLDATDGAELLLAGQTFDGAFVEPTIITVPGNDHRLAVEDIFGPVLTVIEIASFEEAIAVANDTDYGLAASIFTANAKRALRGARMLRAGTVTVNSFGEGDISTPFGGFKQSGFGGRDNGIHAHDQYTQLKTIWLNLTDDADASID